MSGRPGVEDVVEAPLQLAVDGTAHPYPTTVEPARPRRRRTAAQPVVAADLGPVPGQLVAVDVAS
ncbi:hypothetical protein [Kitasatospora sp. NPDC088346]|uniref:hypothetical protein n=1 Tax=Kitasatospora sp. NPDC088346 TaxID=3364073 RepID=UPI00381D31E6